MQKQIEILEKLLTGVGYPKPTTVKVLPVSGSERRYFRFYFEDGTSMIGVYNSDIQENKAHYVFTNHFYKKGLPVPKIHARSGDFRYFILDDLGDITLLQYIESHRKTLGEKDITGLYKKVIDDLLRFQLEGIRGLDLSEAYPVSCFTARSVMWDLNYFKYYFVKTSGVDYNESRLEDDFENFTKRIMQAGGQFFNYRDFQARNIMLRDGKCWYIDFQGGRKGPLQYDLASLLYQAKAQLPETVRDELLHYYLNELEKKLPGKSQDFEEYFDDFVFFRIMQVLGAYGFRGLYHRKAHFLHSIHLIIESLAEQLEKRSFPKELTELLKVFRQITQLKEKFRPPQTIPDKLLVSINSFSYKKSGIPLDFSENGGGFVFDCRALPNPGRYVELQNFNGLDKPVIDFFKDKPEINLFEKHTFQLIHQSVENYLYRKFSHLMVSFGCTGGQHRSVYLAEQLKKYLETLFNVEVTIRHRELSDNSRQKL